MSDPSCLLCQADGFPRVGPVHVLGYEFDVCQSHWDGNKEGWNDHYEWIILDFMNKRAIKVPRKGKKGTLPREYA